MPQQVMYITVEGKQLPETEFLRHIKGGVFDASEPVVQDSVSEAKALLLQSDWTQLADVSIVVRQAFSDWRDKLRLIVSTQDTKAVVPLAPQDPKRFV